MIQLQYIHVASKNLYLTAYIKLFNLIFFRFYKLQILCFSHSISFTLYVYFKL
jgi:hypothetical protein